MIKALLSRDADPAERLRVLLADHDQAMLALTVDALAGECLVVGRVDDGCELLAEAERSHPDAMVLDITMSRFDGIEAARQLRRSQRSVRLVFLTVHEDPNYARTGSDARGLGHVVKARTASDRGRASQATPTDRHFVSPTVSRPRRPTSPTLAEKPNTKIRKAMKQILTPFRILPIIALLALAVGCANTQSKENSLIAAGFRVSVPKTAAQQQKLKTLPPDKVTVVHKDGKTYYVFPDAARNLAYVGGPKEYEAYHQIRLQKKKLEAIEAKEEAEQIDWGGWGS